MSITIREISKNKKDLYQFIKFPDELFAGEKYYVPPLHNGEYRTLSKEINPAYEFCEARFWLAYKNDKIVGRIAGIINNRYNEKTGINYLRFGWLDFIEDSEVLEALISEVKRWGREISAEKIHGPLGFSSFDASGIMVEGFDELPTSFARYNPPYYSTMLEQFGYIKEADWVEYRISVPDEIPEKYIRVSEAIKKRYKLKSVDLNKSEVSRYADQLFETLNEEYSDLYAFSPLTKGQVDELKSQFIPMLNLNYVSIVVNEEDKLVGFGICLPSLSQAFQKSKGKLYPFGIFRIMRALRKNDTVDSLLIAVDKNYKDKGVSAIIFNDVGQGFVNNGVKYVESTRELEGNYSVSNLWNKLENRQHKRSRCYVKPLE